jgi:S-adenosyl-L-methionine hydrolase (adenosine-forming)
MPTPISLITLLTDFGDRDYFVASMKGVILGINPQARMVDLSHHVAPQHVEEAAYLLKCTYRYFPDGTVHIAVVDPGVGSARRALLVTTPRHFYVAPDNGILSYVFAEETSVEVRLIENRQYRLDSEGATFDGRDLFAPAAAWLTKGQAPGSFGRLVRDFVRLPIPEPQWQDQRLIGEVVYVDHFGNLISDFTMEHVKEITSATQGKPPEIRIGGCTIQGMVRYYDEGDPTHPRALINSNGQLEIFLKGGNAAEQLKSGRGERVELA